MRRRFALTITFFLSIHSPLVAQTAPVAVPPLDPFSAAGRDAARATFESLSDDDLEEIFWSCNGEAENRMLGGGEAAFCSFAYEVLLVRMHGWPKLHAWWLAHKDAVVPAALDGVMAAVLRGEPLRGMTPSSSRDLGRAR